VFNSNVLLASAMSVRDFLAEGGLVDGAAWNRATAILTRLDRGVEADGPQGEALRLAVLTAVMGFRAAAKRETVRVFAHACGRAAQELGVSEIWAQIGFGAACKESGGYQFPSYCGVTTASGKLTPGVASGSTTDLGVSQITKRRYYGALGASAPPHVLVADPAYCAVATVAIWAGGAPFASADQFANFWPGAGGGGCPLDVFSDPKARIFDSSPTLEKLLRAADGSYRFAGLRKVAATLFPSTHKAVFAALPRPLITDWI
jgi:hypothetical protein